MKAAISILLFTICLQVMGQEVSFDSFVKQRKYADSLVSLMNGNKELAEKSITGGDTSFGLYKGKVLYRLKDKVILKVECNFTLDTTGSKVLYFNNDNLLKAVDGTVNYYWINDSLVSESGVITNTSHSGKIVAFQKNILTILKTLLSD